MKRQRRYITFYKFTHRHLVPVVDSYGLMCSRSWSNCFRFGLRHLWQGKAFFFKIEKARPKEHLFFP